MRDLFFLFILSSFFFMACESTSEETLPEFTINAEFVGVPDSVTIFLQLAKEGSLESLDSALLSSSSVAFHGILESPQMIYLKIGETRKMVNFFGENSDITIHVNVDSLEKAKVVGSKTHDEFMDFKAFLKPIDERSEKLNDQYREAAQNGDKEKMEALSAESEQIWSDQIDMIYSFLADKNESYISPFVIRRYLSYELEYQELDSLLRRLDPSIQNSRDYISLYDRVETLKLVAVGQPAVDFTLNDPEGNPIALSSFRGKFLLIDFWASWCGPCRRENPNVVELYNDFNGQGFEILGVSLDKDQEKWIGAIESDELDWAHVSDLQGWASAAGKLYGINSIPATVLIDREGVIVAKNLRGDALRKKLEELYTAEEQNI